MRINYSEDEEYSGQFDLWQANCRRSIQGKKGQAALRELEVALLALPTKRLIQNELDNGVDVCAIGALVRYKGITPTHDDYEMELIGEECGMPRLVAWKIVEINDLELSWVYKSPHSVAMTPEERYERVLSWVRASIRS